MLDFKDIIGPVLTFVGTIAVASLGFYQWRRQHSKPNRSAVADARRVAAETLWQKLEEINLRLRSFGEDRRTIDINSDVHELNELYLRNSLYLEDALQVMMNEYLKQLHAVTSALGQYQDGRMAWASTAVDPLHSDQNTELYRAVNIELERMASLRLQVKAALRSAIDA